MADFRTIYYKCSRPNGWVKKCAFCGKSSGERITFVSMNLGKINVCSSIECIRRIFPRYDETEDKLLFVGMFRKNRDRGLECEKCGNFILKGVTILTKESSMQINKYKRGCCDKCLKEVFDA